MEQRAQPEADPQSQPAAEQPRDAEPAPSGAPVVLVLGNSITAGLGVRTEDAFPALLQHHIDSLGWDYEVVNAGLSGETSAGGLRRVDWLLQRYAVDVLILELGGNDGLRGIPPDVTRQNLKAIIDRTQERYPEADIILAGMQIPPNLGPDYTTRFREIFPDLAREEGVHLIPFVLEGVGGIASLNQSDGIHPNPEGHRIVARNVWDVLHPVLAARNDAVLSSEF